MATSSDLNLNQFIINTISKANYDQLSAEGQIQQNELYLVTDTPLDANGAKIFNVAAPVLSSDAATKGYVDEKHRESYSIISNLTSPIPADAKFTDTTYSTATSDELGLVKIGYQKSDNDKNYPVELDNGKAYVNVPWTGGSASDVNVDNITIGQKDQSQNYQIYVKNISTLSNDLTGTIASKDFVNSSIATNTAYFKGTFQSLQQLELNVKDATPNDYAFVTEQSPIGVVSAYNRYKYTVNESISSWMYEYTLNNSSFTQEQWSTINSKLTENDKTKLDGVEAGAQKNPTNYVTTDTAQTITGTKTFNNAPTLYGANFNGTDAQVYPQLSFNSKNGQQGTIVFGGSSADDSVIYLRANKAGYYAGICCSTSSSGNANINLNTSGSLPNDTSSTSDKQIAWRGWVNDKFLRKSDAQTALNAKADDNAVMKLTGDQTATGTKTFGMIALTGSIRGTSDNADHLFMGATEYTKGAHICLSGKDHSNAGAFRAIAINGTNGCTLRGQPDGKLTWTGTTTDTTSTTDTQLPTLGYVNNKFLRKGNLATVATSGSYNDLTNKPTNLVTTDTAQTITGVKRFSATGTATALYVLADGAEMFEIRKGADSDSSALIYSPNQPIRIFANNKKILLEASSNNVVLNNAPTDLTSTSSLAVATLGWVNDKFIRNTRKINNKALTSDITLTATDIGLISRQYYSFPISFCELGSNDITFTSDDLYIDVGSTAQKTFEAIFTYKGTSNPKITITIDYPSGIPSETVTVTFDTSVGCTKRYQTTSFSIADAVKFKSSMSTGVFMMLNMKVTG